MPQGEKWWYLNFLLDSFLLLLRNLLLYRRSLAFCVSHIAVD